jgi:methionine-rich copper-binding protein CopC
MIRGLLITILAGGMIAVGSAVASADDGPGTVIDASPTADSVVVRPPEEISLSFREPVASVHIRLFKDNDLVSSSDAAIEGTLAVAPVAEAGPGGYLVDWKGTDAAGTTIVGAYVFRVDPRGNNSIAVDREIAGASGALGGLRVVAAAIAATGVVALAVGVAGWVVRAPAQPAARIAGLSAMMTGIGALGAGATYGVPSDGFPQDMVDLSTLSSAAASGPGRAWLTAALLMGVVPFILVLGRSIDSRWVAAGAVAVAALSGLWVAVGLGWLIRLPWPLMYIGLATTAVLWLSIKAGRPVAVGISLAVALAVTVPLVSNVRGSATSSAARTGNLLIEASLDPGRSGVNELHLYGFDVSGRGAALGPTSVVAFHQALDVGPLDVPVLRAGPNHFLSYHAMLPLSGDWTLIVTVATSVAGGGESATMNVHLR